MQTMDYSRVRGFNYQPSYGSHGLAIWGEAFDLEAIRTEIGRGKKHFPGMNTLRIWLSHDAYLHEPEALPERFHSVVELAREFDIRFIPTLFNGWHSWPDFGGIAVEIVNNCRVENRFDDVFLPFIEKDGSLRPHHDVFKRY